MRRFTVMATTVLAALLTFATVPVAAPAANAQPPTSARVLFHRAAASTVPGPITGSVTGSVTGSITSTVPAAAPSSETAPHHATVGTRTTGLTTRPAWADKGPYVARALTSHTADGPTPTTSRTGRAHAPAPLTGEHVLATPYAAQPNGYYCGPTAVHMALALRRASPGIAALAAELGTTTAGTGPTPIVTAALTRHTGAPYETTTIPVPASSTDTSQLWNNVVADVDGGFAVVTWIGAPAHEYPYKDLSYALDHYFVVDGYDTRYRTVRISDPANFDGRSRYWITVDRLAYLIAGTPGYAW